MTDALANTFGKAKAEVPRHGGDGRPLIILPEHAGDPTLGEILAKRYDDRTNPERRHVKDKYAYYSRASSYGKAIDDDGALVKWKMRRVAIGIAARRDLQLQVTAHADDTVDENKKILNRLAEDAIEAAKASAAANVGTALHKLAELHDLGLAVPAVDLEATRDLDAYRSTTAGLKMHAAEQFVVCDELGVAGTFDRVVELPWLPGRRFVADLKTGNTDSRTGELAFVNGMAVQLAIYAHSALYDPRDGTREPVGLDTDAAIVIHLPQGTGTARLYWLNIAAGWDAAQMIPSIRAWQSRRDLTMPIERVEVA